MPEVYGSFADLAKALCPDSAQRGRAKAEALTETSAWDRAVRAVGRRGAVIWALLNEEEATRRSGPDGEIVFAPGWIAQRTGFPPEEIALLALRLIRAGLARPAHNGAALKAA